MSADPPAPWPAPIRRALQRALRVGLAVGRRGPFKRHLLRLRFGPWASRLLGGRTLVTWRGVRVSVDPGEAHGFHVFVHGDYGGAETDACIDACRHASVFVDAGAHIGLMTLAVLCACPDTKVVAVEADPAIARWLRHNIALNPGLAPRVTVLEAAAAGRDGDVAFESSTTPGNVGLGRIAGGTVGALRVSAIALGPWLARHGLAPDVVKMDVEGAELEALAGLWAGGAAPGVILLETHGYMTPASDVFNRQLLAALAAHRYQVERLDRGRWHPVIDAGGLGGRDHLRATRTR
jgi:FkbM family methyltransferase